MTAAEVLMEFRQRGVILEVAGDRLRYRAPKGVLTPDLRQSLAAHKVELLRLLTAPPPPARGCFTCQQRRFWQHAETFRWICATCHPPPHVELVERFHDAPQPALAWLGIASRRRTS